jgi:hypothetical protein
MNMQPQSLVAGPQSPAARWREQQHDRRVEVLGEHLAAELEQMAAERLGPGQETALGLMVSVYQIGRGHRDPIAAQRLESIVRTWHRDVCGCGDGACPKRAGIASFAGG